MAKGKIKVGSVKVKLLNHNIPPLINVSVVILSMEVILVMVSKLSNLIIALSRTIEFIIVSEVDFAVESTICLKVNELLMKSGICTQGNK